MEAEYMWKSLKKLLRTSDSVMSLVIGIVMVIIIGMLSYSIISTVREQNQTREAQQNEATLPTAYTVQEGDTLWDISIQFYNTGYNWVDIASANTLENPDGLAIGQVLTIPDTKPITVESGDILDGATTAKPPIHNEITVLQGESLWSIAEREYGTGYKWVDIVKANSIVSDPNLIYPNTILRLP